MIPRRRAAAASAFLAGAATALVGATGAMPAAASADHVGQPDISRGPVTVTMTAVEPRQTTYGRSPLVSYAAHVTGQRSDIVAGDTVVFCFFLLRRHACGPESSNALGHTKLKTDGAARVMGKAPMKAGSYLVFATYDSPVGPISSNRVRLIVRPQRSCPPRGRDQAKRATCCAATRASDRCLQ